MSNARKTRRSPTGYRLGEARALIAPLVGMEPAEIRAYLIIGIGAPGAIGVGGSENLDDRAALALLETLAASMRAEGVTTR